jgi:hypothetical protein
VAKDLDGSPLHDGGIGLPAVGMIPLNGTQADLTAGHAAATEPSADLEASVTLQTCYEAKQHTLRHADSVAMLPASREA